MRTKHNKLQSISSIDSDDVDMDREKSDSIKVYVSLKSKAFIKFVIFQILWIGPWIAGTIVIPLFGAQWFGNCLIQKGIDVQVIDECIPDYVTYNFYFTLFGSIGGAVSFSFASFMGRLSDSFGRKIFLILGIIFWMIPRITLIFYINFYLYWILGIISDINGGDQILPSLKAAISDIIAPKDRVNGFGKMHGAMGTGLIIGAMFAIGISMIYDNYTVLIAISIWYTILFFFTTICIKETIDINNNRIPITRKVYSNPLRPLTVICQNQFIFYISLISFFGSLVEAGVMSSLFGYVGHSLKLNDDGRASMVFGIYVTIVSLVLVPVSIFFLPFLKNKGIHYSHIIVIAITFRIISLFLLALISFNGLTLNIAEYILYGSAILHGAGMFSFAVLEGIVSEYVAKDCQGIAFGVVTSYKGIAGILGPFSFGLLFTVLSDTNISSLFIIVAIAMCIIEIILSLIPLKKLLNKIKPQTVKIRLKGDIDINGMDDDEQVELSNFVKLGTNDSKRILTVNGDGTQKPLVTKLIEDEVEDQND